MRNKLLILFTIIISVSGYSQKQLDSYQPPQTISHPDGVIMKPGFHANSNDVNYGSNSFRAIVGAEEVTEAPVVYIPSSGENYVYSRTYLYPTSQSNDYVPQIQGITYFDGLGRAKQSIAIKASPTGEDLVTHIPYDNLGRQVDSYLPAPMQTLNGTIQPNPESAANSYYGEVAFSHKKLEASPLDRIQSLTQPGNDWQNNPISYDYLTNEINEVLKFRTETSWVNDATESILLLSEGQYYPASSLYKNKVIDEDGNITYDYKNGQGQTLLVRKELSPSESVDTYYVYNEYNQLAYVLSPLAVEEIKNNPAVDLSDSGSLLSHLCYIYRYDGRNRLVEKKLPGKGKEYMVYDKADRLVLTQDTNLKNQGKWLFTKYDQFGRVVYSGLLNSTPDRSTQQSAINNSADQYESYSSSGITLNGLTVFYTSNAYPNNNYSFLSVNYYDTYPNYTDRPSQSSINAFGQALLTDDSNATRSTKGLPTASLVKNIENDQWTKTYNFYDDKGRSVYSHSINHLGGFTISATLLDFSGVALNTRTEHKRTAGTTEEVKIEERFVYDNQNRLKEHYHQVNGRAEELLTKKTYNRIGQLEGKSIGNGLESTAYTYNIRGWMTGINDPDNLGNNLFAYKLKYQNPDTPSTTSPRYNGNISEIDWKTNNDGILRRYNYKYDKLNRLLSAKYQKPNSTVVETNAYNENIIYDINGNVDKLQRYGGFDGNQAQLIDDIKYTYNGNQLIDVWDSSGNYYGLGGGGSMDYDANGNMIRDDAHYIWELKYNYLNLPYSIEKKHEYSEYIYRADGTKVYKLFYNEDEDIRHNYDYLDGFQYYNDILQFVPTSEGYYDFEKKQYIYNYVDHLGNVRLSYTRNGGIPQIIEESNYYPFGLKHEGYNEIGLQNPNYNYKYNGKELQETGMYDYGARMYMPDLGRWGVMDEKTEKYRSWNPYNYAINNPIKYIDPDGKDIINVAGGVRFTGQDAQIAFRAIQQQYNSTGSVNVNKFHFVYQSVTPSIYQHTLNSFRIGKPEVLHYDNDKSRQAQRRKESTGTIPTKPGMQRDEYPYASTFEGGKGANVAYVPSRENSSQGGSLGALYKTMTQGEAFMVIPVPKDREPENVKETVPQKVPTAVKVGAVGAGLIYGGLKFLDWAASKAMPIFMVTPFMMDTANPKPMYDSKETN
ncbi:DUF6443 domain-containing protein [Chryseobacterium sp. T1]